MKLLGQVSLEELCNRISEIFVSFGSNERSTTAAYVSDIVSFGYNEQSSTAAYVSDLNNVSQINKASIKFCKYCKKDNHEIENCFELQNKKK
jgi:hypothetical protein